VRTPPLRAEYNDYGSIGVVHPDDAPIQELWMRGLREDLVQQGQGDNSYHDPPTSRSMSFEDLLKALRSRRVLVTRAFDHPARNLLKEKRWPGSFRARVESVLRAALGGQVSDHEAPGTWCVDEPVPNLARVRYGRYEGGAEHMDAQRRALAVVQAAGMAGAIGAGSGRYGFSPDLLVFPAPSVPGGEHTFGPQWDMAPGQAADKGRPLRVELAMIREDVWQQLIAFPHSEYLSLRCLACDQSSSYHSQGALCPDQSGYGTPLSHPPGSRYLRGPIFPETVEYVVERRGDSEYVWYGLSAFRHAIRASWGSIVERHATGHWPYWAKCDREDEESAPVASEPTPEGAESLARLTARWKAEEDRVAALPQEERASLLAARQADRERYAAERVRLRERPHFTDFWIKHADCDAGDDVSPGAWILRDSIPWVIGIPEHLAMYLADRTEVPDVVLDGIVELAAVKAVAMGVGATWKPAVSSGPQDPEWGEQVRFSRTVLDVALTELSKSREYDDRPIAEAPRALCVAIDRARRHTVLPPTRNPLRWLYLRLRRWFHAERSETRKGHDLHAQ